LVLFITILIFYLFWKAVIQANKNIFFIIFKNRIFVVHKNII